MDKDNIIQVMKRSIQWAVGLDENESTDGAPAKSPIQPGIGEEIRRFLTAYVTDEKQEEKTPLFQLFLKEAREAEEVFAGYYLNHPEVIGKYREALEGNTDHTELDKLTARLWLPELTLPEAQILPKWKLSQVEKAPAPIRPTEVTIQLNALYTCPEHDPPELTGELREEWNRVRGNYGRKIADYDHPVTIFEDDKHHELATCLDELDRDIGFEKKRGVFPEDHQVIITLSVSVTHENLDRLCSLWIEDMLKRNQYRNLTVLILTESAVRVIRDELFHGEIPVYSVFGKYGRHFNALKYTQLLLETGFGIRAGFKLDTDEGIHSEDLFRATGKTWFETLCHPYWGGTGVNWKGEPVELAVNEGEYVNSTDVDALGYADSLRTPDVKPPDTCGGSNIFFHKGFAHAGATALYNTFHHLEDFISHPVVKGGGYGIMNGGLRKARPFTFSEVGRAEDQQFYFCGLAHGIAGIFHPDLRIVHYKSSVAKAEDKTQATRFIGDMYRLIIFQALVEMLGVKESIDPMPGVFAGPLARSQAFFHTLYNAFIFSRQGKAETAAYLCGKGLEELRELKRQIDSGEIETRIAEEQRQWSRFVELTDSLSAEKTRNVLKPFFK